MAFGGWTPFRRDGNQNAMVRSGGGAGLTRIQSEMNRMFDEMFGSSPGSWALPSAAFGETNPSGPSGFVPRVDMSQADDMVMITAEMPGMSADDIELNCQSDRLQIRGQKNREASGEEDGYFRTERSFGAFERTIALPEEVDFDQAEANFKNGVLTVRMPRVENPQRRRQIDINAES